MIMKTIGLIGGMSWESTVTYYARINEVVNASLGGLHSAKCLLFSIDFEELDAYCLRTGNWQKGAAMMTEAAQRLERGGADFIVICTNTMHKVVPQMREVLSVPVLHIAEVTAEVLRKAGICTAGLLGTRFTMQEGFYTDVLQAAGVRVLLPDADERTMIDRVIFDELCHGIVSGSSKAAFLDVIAHLAARGAEGIVLGCTELGLLVQQADTSVPLFDTALIHAEAAARAAMA